MTTISLGSITPGKVSLFKVGAVSSISNTTLTYSYKSGSLPPGLKIQADGEIIGICGDVNTETNFTFKVEASGSFGNITVTQDYSIRVKVPTTDQIANMYGKLHTDQNTLTAYQNFVNSRSLFPTTSLFRPSDPNFNTKRPKFLFLAGVHATFLSTVSALLVNNNYNTTLYMGEYKLAEAKASDGTVLYEVVYVDLIDPKAGGPNKITLTDVNLPSITVDLTAGTSKILTDSNIPILNSEISDLYLNVITRMQDEVKAGLTIENFEYLPLWMKSPQSDGLVLGHKIALVIRYLKPGEGAKTLYRLKNESTYNIQSLPCNIDRWYIDRYLATAFDQGPYVSTHTGDGSTKIFSIPYNVNRSSSLSVTLGGVATTDFVANDSADTTDIFVSTGDISADISLNGLQLEFNTAPITGTTILITLNKTTFGKSLTTVFDSDSSTSYLTTFDDSGTSFSNELVTFDRKDVEEQAIVMQRSSITDRITHVSKQRELLRTT
jgi:hypothetical protein|tara:strand:- start:3640 stop:5118 length:1479 start_codon:yes stop_codon:yes gene_type:complete